MAKKIIILSKVNGNDSFALSYLYWLDVPIAQQALRANPNATSSYPNATTAEVDAIKSGAIVEMVKSSIFKSGTTPNFIKQSLANDYGAEQTLLNNETQWQYYGTYWDGTSWTTQGV